MYDRWIELKLDTEPSCPKGKEILEIIFVPKKGKY